MRVYKIMTPLTFTDLYSQYFLDRFEGVVVVDLEDIVVSGSDCLKFCFGHFITDANGKHQCLGLLLDSGCSDSCPVPIRGFAVSQDNANTSRILSVWVGHRLGENLGSQEVQSFVCLRRCAM